MSGCTHCGCTTCSCTSALPCGCCEGSAVLTPAPVHNRPGLAELAWRVGTHASFFETMKARLAATEVEGTAEDGQTVRRFRPLQALGTRDSSDFAIALLDGWATVADLLSFYQERIANEGYLRTATERRSVLELARLVGYTLRPGVAASVHLAYTLDDNQLDPTLIPAGARAQSLPGPGETPQSFETSEDLEARREWNNLQVRLTKPQAITLATAATIERVIVADRVNGLRAGDPLLLVFADDGSRAALRSIRATEGPAADGSSIIQLDPVPAALAATSELLVATVLAMEAVLPRADAATARVISGAGELLNHSLLDPATAEPREWARLLRRLARETDIDAEVQALIETLEHAVEAALEDNGTGEPPQATGPDDFVAGLLKPRVPQARNRLRLRRDLDRAFAPGADTAPQLLLSFEPRLRDSYYRAWAGAAQNVARPVLKGVFVLRSSASLFGSTAPRLVTVRDGEVPPQDQWREWTLDGETRDGLYLDSLHPEIAAPSYAVVRRMDRGQPLTRVFTVMQATPTPRTAYGISGKSTHLRFDRDWWQARVPNADGDGSNDMAVLRATQVWAQSEALHLVEEPITEDVGSRAEDTEALGLELAALHQELPSGRWVILQGERTDIEGVSGVTAAELMMVAALTHGFDDSLPGDKVHTTLRLATRSAYRYRRESLVVWGNVVRATHGESHDELLGSGDASQSLQRFGLKQPPLTFVSAPTAAGAESTLTVRVDGQRWHEAASLAELGPRDRGFVTRTDDDGITDIVFGDGTHGARLPTGVQNVMARYRHGIGAPGHVKPGQISLLVSRPLGVKAVVNPLRASGGADREDRDLARANAPLAVAAMERLVSVSDYADFARTFAGIAKASAVRASDGRRELLLLTIAGVDDAPIEPTSDLYRNLLAALRRLGDPDLPLRLMPRELRALVLSAGVAVRPDHRFEDVAPAIRDTLLRRFGFAQRALGQGVCLAELIAAMQGVRGVSHVDVDAFGAIPEKFTDDDGVRRLMTQSLIRSVVTGMLHPEPSASRKPHSARLPPDVIAFPGGRERGVLRPAELTIFSPDVPDTLILNALT